MFNFSSLLLNCSIYFAEYFVLNKNIVLYRLRVSAIFNSDLA